MGCLNVLFALALLVGTISVIMVYPPLSEYADIIKAKVVPLAKHLPFSVDTIGVKPTVFTKAELALYDGSPDSKGLYLAMLGKVYDVSKGARHYGPGGGYSFFAAKDGSRGFVTGDFTDEGLTDDLDGLTPGQMLDLTDWTKLYENDYVYVGLLEGRFYDAEGRHTAAYARLQDGVTEGRRLKADKAADSQLFPACNSEWSQASGGRVWCSTKSGGIHRDWVGVPRLYHRPGSDGTRCACVRTQGPPNDDPNSTSNRGDLENPRLNQYEGCPPKSESCRLPKK